jgi:hypothetical protein
MGYSKRLTLIGGVLLLAGLLTAFCSSHYRWADFWFYAGLLLTAGGVVLQTLGTLLPIDQKIKGKAKSTSGTSSILSERPIRMISFEDDLPRTKTKD